MSPSKFAKSPISAINHINKTGGLVYSFSNALRFHADTHNDTIPWEFFKRKLVEVCTGNKF